MQRLRSSTRSRSTRSAGSSCKSGQQWILPSGRVAGATFSNATVCARATLTPRRSSLPNAASRVRCRSTFAPKNSSRETVGVERLDSNDIPNEVESWVDYLREDAHKRYTPISFWDDLDVYVEVAVREARPAQSVRAGVQGVARPDHQLQGLERPQRPRGDDAALRCTKREGGDVCCCCVAITIRADCTSPRQMRKNLEDLAGAVGWSPENLVIIRFGLNADFIDRVRSDLDRQSGDVERRTARRSQPQRSRQALRSGLHRAIWRAQMRGQRARRRARSRPRSCAATPSSNTSPTTRSSATSASLIACASDYVGRCGSACHDRADPCNQTIQQTSSSRLARWSLLRLCFWAGG